MSVMPHLYQPLARAIFVHYACDAKSLYSVYRGDVAAAVSQSQSQRVAESSALKEGGRIHVTVEGRYLTILRLDGELSCIDSVCFHAGGPLGLGDIEEVNGRSCLVCPWHYYKIDIKTGDKYYQQVQFVNGKMQPGDWASNGIKQRTHKVEEHDGGIYVTLSKPPPGMESDQYARNATCGDRVLQNKSAQQGSNVGGDGRKPSGSVIKAAREAAMRY